MKEGPIGYKLSRGKGELLTGLWPDLRPYSWPLRSGSGSRSALRHSDLACRCLSAIPARQRGLLDGLRHGDPTHRYLSGILGWRRGASGRSSARRPYPQAPQRHPRVAKGASGRSSARHPYPQVLQGHPRVAKRVSWPVFGTATPPTGTSVAFSRSHCELVYRIVAILGFVKFTWNELLLIIK